MPSRRAPDDMRLMLARIVMQLVDDPRSVRVEAVAIDATTYMLQLTVAAKDLGRVVGLHGRIARSLRIVVRAMGIPEGLTYHLNIASSKDAGPYVAD